MLTGANSSPAIVFVTLAYAPEIGGAERQAQQILERWAKSGQDVWVLTRRVRGAPLQETIGGVHVFRLWSIWLPVLSWLTFTFSVVRFLLPRRDRVRSLWGLMLNVSTLALVSAAQMINRPTVIKITGSGEGNNIRLMPQSLVGGWMVLLLRICDYVIVLNQQSVDEIQTYDVQPQRIQLIPNGVDVELFHPVAPSEKDSLRREIGLAEAESAVLFVGRLEEQKNLPKLVDAWPAVTRDFPQARLWIVGEGSLEESLKRIISEKGLDDSIRLLGKRSDVICFYQACDLFVLPSRAEGLSNALLEAMACGMPCVVSRIPGNSDVVQDGVQGRFIDPSAPTDWHRPIVELLKDAGLRAEYGRAARKRMEEKFSLEAVLVKYQALSMALDSQAAVR